MAVVRFVRDSDSCSRSQAFVLPPRSPTATTATTMFGVVKSCRLVIRHSHSTRHLHASACISYRGNKYRSVLPSDPLEDEEKDLVMDEVETLPHNTSLGSYALRQQRQLLYYMRLIEHELPQLVGESHRSSSALSKPNLRQTAFRKPFVPPPPSHPLVLRSITFGGEDHPVLRKRTIVTPVSRLPLKNKAAIHKFKLVAGVRWTPDLPKDAGFGPAEDEEDGEHGYFKISCEDFPEPAMNLKWASDILDKLIAEANVSQLSILCYQELNYSVQNAEDTFADVPLDPSHVIAKIRKAGKGDHVWKRGAKRPSIRDFPKEWLPPLPVDALSTSMEEELE